MQTQTSGVIHTMKSPSAAGLYQHSWNTAQPIKSEHGNYCIMMLKTGIRSAYSFHFCSKKLYCDSSKTQNNFFNLAKTILAKAQPVRDNADICLSFPCIHFPL